MGKRAKVTYILKPNEPYYIGNVAITANNPVLDSIIRKHQKDSKVLPGARFSIDKLDLERRRLSNIFRDEGFYAFSPDYIRFTLDSFSDVSSINLELQVTNQVNGEGHAIWTVDSIEVYPDYRVQQRSDTAVSHQRNYKGLSIFGMANSVIGPCSFDKQYFMMPVIGLKHLYMTQPFNDLRPMEHFDLSI